MLDPSLQEHYKTKMIQQEHHKTEYYLCEVMAELVSEYIVEFRCMQSKVVFLVTVCNPL